MRTSRLVVWAALAGAICLAATASASGAVTRCATEGTVKLSPGLTTTPAVQKIEIKGRMSGCAGESAVTEGTFQLIEQTAEPVTCAALKEGGSTLDGSIKLKWVPKSKEGSVSLGSAGMPLIEGEAMLEGAIERGRFAPGLEDAHEVVEYKDPEDCVAKEGSKPRPKAVKAGSFAGELTIS
jgi:hypothetical protein